jgi:hypothetical protein
MAGLQPPHERELGIDDPILQILGTDVTDLAETTFGNELPSECHRRHAPVVERHHRTHAVSCCPVGRGRHDNGLVDGVRQRLLAQDVLAGVERGDGHLGVRVSRRAHVDEIDVVAVEQILPASGELGPAQPPRGRGGTRTIAPRENAHDRLAGQVEEMWRSTPCLRMRRAHEGVADHPDPEFVLRHVVSVRSAAAPRVLRGTRIREAMSGMRTRRTKPLCRTTTRETISSRRPTPDDETTMRSALNTGPERGDAR